MWLKQKYIFEWLFTTYSLIPKSPFKSNLIFSFDIDCGVSPGRSPLEGYPGLVLQVNQKFYQWISKIKISLQAT